MRHAALALVLMFATPAAAVTPDGGAVSSTARITVGPTTEQQNESDLADGLPGTLASQASVRLADGDGQISVFSSMRATWASATRGQTEMQWGWDARNPTSVNPTLVETVPPGLASWSYRFTTGATVSRFVARWSLDVTGDDTLGIQGVYGSGALPFTVTPFRTAPQDDAGSFTVVLAPNQFYSLDFYNFGNLGRADRGLDSVAAGRFLLDWEIAPGNEVPEPQGWAMMIAGFGLVGAASRRARQQNGARGRI